MEQNTLNVIIIIILSILLIISILGINILQDFFNIILAILRTILQFIMKFLGSVSGETGEVINGTGDVVTDTGIFGLELTNNMIRDVGNMFMGKATPTPIGNQHLDIVIQTGNKRKEEPQPMESTKKGNEKWCFIGVNNEGDNKCVKLHADQKCQSSKSFTTNWDCSQYKP
jgi:hypothetical protein